MYMDWYVRTHVYKLVKNHCIVNYVHKYKNPPCPLVHKHFFIHDFTQVLCYHWPLFISCWIVSSVYLSLTVLVVGVTHITTADLKLDSSGVYWGDISSIWQIKRQKLVGYTDPGLHILWQALPQTITKLLSPDRSALSALCYKQVHIWSAITQQHGLATSGHGEPLPTLKTILSPTLGRPHRSGSTSYWYNDVPAGTWITVLTALNLSFLPPTILDDIAVLVCEPSLHCNCCTPTDLPVSQLEYWASSVGWSSSCPQE